MSDDIKTYYTRYHDKPEGYAYTMEGKAKLSSRVAFLSEYITKNTPKGGKILDIGCGDMYLSTVLTDYEWTGIDLAPAPKAPIDKITVHDLSDAPYPFKFGTFDTIVCSEVLEHVWDLRIVNKEARRLIKKGGNYIVSTPNFDHLDLLLTRHRALLFDHEHSHLFEHIRQYNLEVHSKYLNMACFAIKEFVGADAHFSQIFQNLRASIKNKTQLNDTEVDVIIGKGFPEWSHTIVIRSEAI